MLDSLAALLCQTPSFLEGANGVRNEFVTSLFRADGFHGAGVKIIRYRPLGKALADKRANIAGALASA